MKASSKQEDTSLFEAEPNKPKGVEVLKLRKVFRGQKKVVAVDSVTFNAFEGEITALLGHNGAGKTTTMSMLTGLFSPTSGEAKINGYNIRYKNEHTKRCLVHDDLFRNDIENARDSLGLCPQHNMLFPNLTVFEHLIFFGMIKGLSWSEAKKEGESYIEKLNLGPKKNEASTSLSGGMKRKLHLAMALTGDSKVTLKLKL